MIIDFLGDSITAGAGAQKVENMFSYLLCKKLGAKENNYGVGGTRIARQRLPSKDPGEDEDYQKRAPLMDKNADLVIVFGGTNDYGHGDAPLGKLGDKDPYTFYGAVENLIEELLGMYPVQKILFVQPLLRYDEDNLYGERKTAPAYPLSAYRKAIAEVCKKHQIRLADFTHEFPCSTSPKGDQYHIDGLHPNVPGHALLADVFYRYIQENHLLS